MSARIRIGRNLPEIGAGRYHRRPRLAGSGHTGALGAWAVVLAAVAGRAYRRDEGRRFT